jgi:two-component system sensor histidine kinase/response regulator
MSSLRLNIGAKVLLLALLLAWPPLIIVSFLGLSNLDLARDIAVRTSTDALREQAEQALQKRASDKGMLYNTTLANVQQQLEGLVSYARTVIASPPPANLGNERVWISPSGPTPELEAQYAITVQYARQMTPLLRSVVDSNPLVSLAYVGFEDGGVSSFDRDIVDTLAGIQPFDVRERVWYQQAKQLGRTIWADTYIDANTKKPVVSVATPLYDAQGKIIGVVGFDLLLETILEDVLRVDPGLEGFAFLINREGGLIAGPDMEFNQNTWDKPLETNNLRETNDPTLRRVVERMSAQEWGVARVVYADKLVYLAYAPIATAGWSVGIVVPETEIIAAGQQVGAGIAERQYELRTQISAAVGISLLAVLFVGMVISIVLARPLRRLADAAQRIASGDLNYQIDGRGEDEVGQLVASFNTMTIALREKVQELENNLHQISTLNEVSNRFLSILSLPELLDTIPQVICRHFGFDRAALYLIEKDQLLAVSASFGDSDETQAQEFLRIANAEPIHINSETIEADVIRSGQAIIIDNPLNNPRVIQRKLAVSQSSSYVQVPLFGHERQVIGVISADYYHRQRQIDARDAAQLLAFAGMVGLTIENLRLYNELEQQVAQRTVELRSALERAQEADRLKGEFLASISHELRTPLNSIIGFSTVLLDQLDGPLSNTQLEDLRTINRNGRFLLHLINELLDLAKIEAGKLDLQLEHVDIASMIADVSETAHGLLYSRPVALQAAVSLGLPPVRADRAKLRQILLNLLSNAVKFTERGEITLFARLVVLPERGNGVEHLETKKRYIAMSVRDTGIGIAPEHIGQIFDEFRQVSAQHHRVRGSGLGLAITRKLIEAHQGRIWVNSKLGQGSTFTFILPVAEGESAQLSALPKTTVLAKN